MIHFKAHTPFWKRLVTVLVTSVFNFCFTIWHWIEFTHLAQLHFCPFNKSYGKGFDRWTKTNWSRILHWDNKVFRWGNAYNGIREVVWIHRWLPRSCSYCGSIHPDDAIKLCEEGWTISKTEVSKFALVTEVWVPKPKVILYSQHLEFKQLKKIEECFEKQVKRKAQDADR